MIHWCFRSLDSNIKAIKYWRNRNFHLIYLSHINRQKQSQQTERKYTNKARHVMLSEPICWQKAHSSVALKLPSNQSSKIVFFFITSIKSSALPYNVQQMVAKPVSSWLPERKANYLQWTMQVICKQERSLRNSESMHLAPNDHWYTKDCKGLLQASIQPRWHI